jgi:hypothetical protein
MGEWEPKFTPSYIGDVLSILSFGVSSYALWRIFKIDNAILIKTRIRDWSQKLRDCSVELTQITNFNEVDAQSVATAVARVSPILREIQRRSPIQSDIYWDARSARVQMRQTKRPRILRFRAMFASDRIMAMRFRDALIVLYGALDEAIEQSKAITSKG